MIKFKLYNESNKRGIGESTGRVVGGTLGGLIGSVDGSINGAAIGSLGGSIYATGKILTAEKRADKAINKYISLKNSDPKKAEKFLKKNDKIQEFIRKEIPNKKKALKYLFKKSGKGLIIGAPIGLAAGSIAGYNIGKSIGGNVGKSIDKSYDSIKSKINNKLNKSK